jgi:hypothetical protein
MTPGARRAWPLWGIAAAVAYVATVWLAVRPLPIRILYEGMAPLPPYRWVNPPAELAGTNAPPTPWTGAISYRAESSEPTSLASGDGQVIAVFRQGALAPRAGEAAARVTLTPLDPATLAPPPAGLRFDGNAYRIDAVYAASGAPAVLRLPVTVVLRYARHSTTLWRFDAPAWTRLPATVVPESMQIFATSDRLGAFVAAGPPAAGAATSWWAYAAGAALLLLAGLALLRGRLTGSTAPSRS